MEIGYRNELKKEGKIYSWAANQSSSALGLPG